MFLACFTVAFLLVVSSRYESEEQGQAEGSDDRKQAGRQADRRADKPTETDRGRNTDGDKTGKYKMEI